MSKRELNNAAVVKTACVLLVGILTIGYATHKEENGDTSIVAEPTQKTVDVDVKRGTTVSSIKVNDQVTVVKPYFSCASQDDLDRIKKLAMINKDAKAAASYGLAHECNVQKEREVFNVENISGWHGSVCIRKTGNPECAWFPEQLLAKIN